MDVCDVNISDLNPAKYNPRKITNDELTGLKESIKKFGFVEPIVVNRRNNVIVGGHQRLKAAELLSKTSVPVYWVDLPPAEEKALNVALNASTIQGNFDLEVLDVVLKDIGNETPELISALRFDALSDELGLDLEPGIVNLPELNSSDPDFQQMTFVLSNEQKDLVDEALENARKTEQCDDGINKNRNGNALAAALKRYLHG